ncbi:putative mitochondrial protein [Vitis vinifera]|uniref:Putative mitochondrial protein n=1 Tax=Vitis vinifera TaxID=29760 RepID=A0A438CJ20_VITVI|nr:putative mitochondrial protein [Vitis vinifera]
MMVNGTPKGFFQSSRGLRQGDLLSPYLFVIVMEVFSLFIKRAVEGGFISSCKVKGRNEEGVQISHLLLANDTLVFFQASQDQLTYLSWLLMWFEAVSGLRINLEKSELIPVGRVENIDDLAWTSVVEWVVSRLLIWVFLWVLHLSRATLIRSTLSNLPIYFMSLLRLPSSVRRRLEQIQRDFLWGGGNLERKPHLALLSKWNWQYANEKEALWNQVIRGKYGENRGVGALGSERGTWRGALERNKDGLGVGGHTDFFQVLAMEGE